MQPMSNLFNYFFKHQFVRYLFIGGSTFVIDFGLLVILHDILNFNVLVAASISYWTSIIFNFTINRYWTFNSTEKGELKKHIVEYSILLAFNYAFTIGFIAAATGLGLHYTIAKVLAVGLQISWTYYIYKNVIFKS